MGVRGRGVCEAMTPDDEFKNGTPGFLPRVGQWLYATCSAQNYGQIIGVGADSNGQPTIDIRVEDPNDLIDCPSCDDVFEEPNPDEFCNPLTTLEVPADVKLILRKVLWKSRGKTLDRDCDLIECNTPTEGCYRCVKLFRVHEKENNWS